MNTIYDNTFVLGQTSATNFVAGNGIKIDSPSAGTVRIGTDETVLYSGVLTSAANLSEPMTNFEKIAIRVYPDTNNSGAYHSVHYITPDVGSDRRWDLVDGQGLDNCWISINQVSANNTFTILAATRRKAINFGGFTTTATSTTGLTAANCVIIKEVRGINRINA